MSAQTGAPAPSGPASQRFVDRARFRFELLQKEPNPIWIRELKQAARLGRTPVILTVITVLMTPDEERKWQRQFDQLFKGR